MILRDALENDDLSSGVMFAATSRVFRETVGETPMQYVLANRIEQAVGMMKDPARPLGDIALACGFADQAHF